MPDHIRTKTAEEAEKEKWRLAPIGDRAELTVEGEAICNVMGQQNRYLLEKVIQPMQAEIKSLKTLVGRLDKASHAE